MPFYFVGLLLSGIVAEVLETLAEVVEVAIHTTTLISDILIRPCICVPRSVESFLCGWQTFESFLPMADNFGRSAIQVAHS